MTDDAFWTALAAAITATGSPNHVERLIDAIGADIAHDLVTVTRYSATRQPQFVTHRGYSEHMRQRYLEQYYVYDPFYAHWRNHRRPGILPLNSFASPESRRGRYIAEFLAQSRIRDEVGVLLPDGGDWCLGIFLDRKSRAFRERDITTLRRRFPVFAALHARGLALRGGDRHDMGAPLPALRPVDEARLPAALWPALSPREREIVELILAGHPTRAIAERLAIAHGTAKNHRRRIYAKLDITSERELFLQFLEYQALSLPAPESGRDH